MTIMPKRKIKLLDVVALVEDIPTHKLRRGEVGTVVDIFSDGALEVEFADEEGQTYAELALEPEQIVLLHKQGKTLKLSRAA
jgi:hypothetical protein